MGIITGIRDSFGRAFPGVEYENNGYAMRLLVPQNLSASDLTCVMIKRSVFDTVGGMDEEMSYICSAVDLYLKMGKTGKRHLFETRAEALIDAKVQGEDEWIDFGGISETELKKFCEKWPEETTGTDVNYNPNMTQLYAGYVVKNWSEIKGERRI